MHDTALEIGRRFFETYGLDASTIVDIGACNINGTLRDVCPSGAFYVGLDVAPGPGVDVVIKSNVALPLASASVDIVASSSTFEHDEFFWQTFLEMARIAKPNGIIYISAPSNGKYHRYPVDNWRFYPDSGKALANWASTHDQKVTLIESFMADRMGDVWNDFVAIFRKAGPPIGGTVIEFLSDIIPCTNAWRLDEPVPRFVRVASEDMVLIQKLQAEVEQLRQELSEIRSKVQQPAQKDGSAFRRAWQSLVRPLRE
jgi:SAM-dependent methyltransferase